jgi:hypothetical protein
MDWQLHDVIAPVVYLFVVALVVALVWCVGLFSFRLSSHLNRLASPSFDRALHLYPVPRKLRTLSGWTTGYLRDKWYCLCWVKACEEGLLVSRRTSWLRPPRIFVPWDAFSGPRTVPLPWYVSLLGTGFIEVSLKGVSLTVILAEQLWQFYPGVRQGRESLS